jgi:hypothetical protein
MRYLPQVVFIASLFVVTSSFADVCCPSGCVPSGYGNACWYVGTNNSCGVGSTCGGSRSGGGGGGGGRGGGGVSSGPVPCEYVMEMYPTSAMGLADLTNRCLAALSGNAQFWGCLFEDDAGRAEDKRTGLTCPQREAALANQCQARCKNFASNRLSCHLVDQDWQAAFGDIGGVTYGSAQVDRCGPRLKSNFISSGRIRQQRLSP